MNVRGQTVLVTGAGTGMGLEATRRFARAGARVIMTARNADRLRVAAAEFDDAVVFPADLAVEEDLEALLEFVETEHPGTSVALLNAGVTHTYRLFTEVWPRPLAEMEMTTNYLSAVTLVPRLVPLLARNEDSTLIVTTSGVAFAPDLLNPTYSATKAALHSFIQSVRLQLERDGTDVRVVEFMAPLVDSTFSKDVHSDQKMSAADAIDQLISGLDSDEDELRIGASETVFRALATSSDAALRLVNRATGD